MAAAVTASTVAGWGRTLDELLHTGRRPRGEPGRPGLDGKRGVLFIILGGGLYGAVMATFSFEPERALQVVYGALKVPMLFGITMLLAVPGFYVLNAIKGLSEDFSKVFALLVDYQVLVVIVLVSLSPVTALLTLTTADSAYGLIQLWNTLVFLTAALLAQWKFSRNYRVLVARDVGHRLLLRVWTILYAFVGIQMGWTLRPFIGIPGSEVAFVRDTELDNAYIELFKIFSRTLGM